MPGAALLFAALVFLALRFEPQGEDPVVSETEYLMAGPALAQLVPGPGTAVQLQTGTGVPAARLTATASLDAAGTLSAGVAAVIPREFAARVPGRLVKVQAVVRAGPDSDVREARLGYFTVGEGDSGWRVIPVTDAFETVGFCHRVSENAPDNEMEFAGVWPDIRGAGRIVLLRELRVTIQPEGVTPQQCAARFAASARAGGRTDPD